MDYHEYAVVDIGSNSLRLMRGHCDDDGHWHFSPKELATTRLGSDIDKTGRLSPDGMEASFSAMQEWQDTLQGIPVCAVATSAVREARDGQAFLAEIRARYGWHCRIISGLEEAAYSFRGATAAATPNQEAVVLDIGGGSSEMAIGHQGQAAWSHSYMMGAVRCSQGLVTAADYGALETRCLGRWLPLPIRPDILIGVGGTLTSLAAMELELEPYDPERVEGTVISLASLSAWIDRLARMTPEQRRHVKGLQPRRSEIILAGLVIARSCLRFYEIPAITISERDLLEGVFYSQAFQDGAWFG